MTSKPFYLSLTIVGALVHLFITLAAVFGVDLGDQTGAITQTIEQCTLAAGGFLATFSTIVGRIRARKPITLGSTPPALKMLLLVPVLAPALTGCATQSPTTTAIESYTAEAAGVAATTATVELVGGQSGGPGKAAIATDFLTVANAGYTIVASGNLTTAQIDAIFESFKSDANTTSFDSIAEDIAQQLELYLQANPNANAQEVVTSFFQGVQLAASALGGTTPPVAAAGPDPENGFGGSRRPPGDGPQSSTREGTVARRSTATLFIPRSTPFRQGVPIYRVSSI